VAALSIEIRNRGVGDILIACVDGLKGFPEAITAVYPRTEVRLHRTYAQVRWLVKHDIVGQSTFVARLFGLRAAA
jgi:transposase-like protein